ncbi:uncharacterized protein CC84DRAFT_1132384 [Paraphaeosphaeria sporulosa]|uniref:Uncharacterized protein n=1 Tax=Paraphaeosphaeria sporulosa TaxID=1460663 RepID=A0A177BWX2_9PLEO|nr:uncharacterized protein CC84DRAFT_1132384 [Paraphaeosphaeria sporulosa]OAF98866.1 hypothetical protein CC84DRAFT_1132384 [Paraphaeosphaeria sporulosa]
MCFPAKCKVCNKASWQGCGQHVPRVMKQIPSEEWCTCEPQVEREGEKYPPKAQ